MAKYLRSFFNEDIISIIDKYNPIWEYRINKNSGAWLSIHRELETRCNLWISAEECFIITPPSQIPPYSSVSTPNVLYFQNNKFKSYYWSRYSIKTPSISDYDSDEYDSDEYNSDEYDSISS